MDKIQQYEMNGAVSLNSSNPNTIESKVYLNLLICNIIRSKLSIQSTFNKVNRKMSQNKFKRFIKNWKFEICCWSIDPNSMIPWQRIWTTSMNAISMIWLSENNYFNKYSHYLLYSSIETLGYHPVLLLTSEWLCQAGNELSDQFLLQWNYEFFVL